ncbi:hypothetical protein [Acinetobacter indicus]|uniref:hypothetical protein n=1 Tax=Acinetobacter indicus TaxID=756892 RepID=UPI0014444509|nr:hypothetical protein [Acinetobacter indicus]
MDIQRIKELALANGFKLKEQVSGNMDLNAYVYDFANAIEQEVRVQADQKVKLLLCDEHLKKCESPTGIFNSQYPDEEPCLICLAKEAKVQAVQETQQALNDRLLVKSIREHVESHIAEISVNDLFDKGWLAAMKCIKNNIDMLEAQEQTND